MKVTTLCVCLFAGTLLAQPPASGPGPGRGPGGPSLHAPGAPARGAESPAALQEALQLTEEQVNRLQQLRRERGEAVRAVHEQLRTKQRSLREMLESGTAAPAAVGQLFLEITGLRAEAEAIQEDFRAQAVAVLDATQQGKLAAMENAHRLQSAIRQAVGIGFLEADNEGPQGARPGAGPRPGQGPGDGQRGPGQSALTDYLGLSDTQLEQIRQLRQDRGDATRPIRQAIEDKHRMLGELVDAGNADSVVVGQILLDIEALRKQAVDLGERFRQLTLAVLDSNQQARLPELDQARELLAAARQAVAWGLIDAAIPGAGPGGPGLRPGRR